MRPANGRARPQGQPDQPVAKCKRRAGGRDRGAQEPNGTGDNAAGSVPAAASFPQTVVAAQDSGLTPALDFSRFSSTRHPTPRRFAVIVVGRLEYGFSQRRLYAQDPRAVVGETMLAAGRHDDELPRGDGRMVVADPDVGLAFIDPQHFLDRMQMRRRAVPRLAPLFENAELRRAIPRRYMHFRQHGGTPFFLRLTIEIDDVHESPKLA